jgi:hypothetical protein
VVIELEANGMTLKSMFKENLTLLMGSDQIGRKERFEMSNLTLLNNSTIRGFGVKS